MVRGEHEWGGEGRPRLRAVQGDEPGYAVSLRLLRDGGYWEAVDPAQYATALLIELLSVTL